MARDLDYVSTTVLSHDEVSEVGETLQMIMWSFSPTSSATLDDMVAAARMNEGWAVAGEVAQMLIPEVAVARTSEGQAGLEVAQTHPSSPDSMMPGAKVEQTETSPRIHSLSSSSLPNLDRLDLLPPLFHLPRAQSSRSPDSPSMHQGPYGDQLNTVQRGLRAPPP